MDFFRVTVWLLPLAFLVGCHSRMTVKVERIYESDDTTKMTRLQSDSRIGRGVLETHAFLVQYHQGLKDIKSAAHEVQSSLKMDPKIDTKQLLSYLPGVDPKAAPSVTVRALNTEIDGLIREITLLEQSVDTTRVALETCWEMDANEQKPTIIQTLMNARGVVVKSTNALSFFLPLIHALPGATRSTTAEDATQPASSFERRAQKLSERMDALVESRRSIIDPLRPNPGFGGFQCRSVFEINPSDPHYRKLLSKKAIVLADEPLTYVYQHTSGDGLSMIVVESPGQVRLHHLSGDPTQLIVNTSLILQKAVTAALKIATAM